MVKFRQCMYISFIRYVKNNWALLKEYPTALIFVFRILTWSGSKGFHSDKVILTLKMFLFELIRTTGRMK